jgi:hypothetical protein
MARPAASSDAELMRKPLESFCMAELTLASVLAKLLWAWSAAMLVLTDSDMIESSLIFLFSDHPWPLFCCFDQFYLSQSESLTNQPPFTRFMAPCNLIVNEFENFNNKFKLLLNAVIFLQYI